MPGQPRRSRALIGLFSIVLVACSAATPTTPPATYSAPVSASPVPTGGPTATVDGGSPTAAASVGPTATSATATPTLIPTARPTPRPTARRTPVPTPRPTPRPTATPAPTGWDPNHVTVKFSTVATVPGRPLAIANAGDGSGRLFVAEQGGAVYILQGGSVSTTPFLDISSQVSGGGEQGLLGLAFHPAFPVDPRVFVDYTDTSGNTVVSSFTVDPGSPNSVRAGSEVAILHVTQPYANHNGGGIAFGPDGYLYIALGDGGSAGDPQNHAQDLDSLLGKILRIDVDHPSSGRQYGIPSSNPFVGIAGADEVWLYGLRNPFRFSFDRKNGDLWIGDVGQNLWEEVDVARAGEKGLNFGWRVMEGNHCYNPPTGCSTSGKTLPVVEYSHDFGCAIIGGIVYRGSAYPVLRGGYVFSDECTGITWALDAAGSGAQPLVQVAQGPTGIAGYGESDAGELYAADLSGSIYRVSGVAR